MYSRRHFENFFMDKINYHSILVTVDKRVPTSQIT
jgi:hypothetical protein